MDALHSQHRDPVWHHGFICILPQIERQLEYGFRDLDVNAREEAIQEGIVNCCVAYERLFRQGRAEFAFPTALARFAIRRIKGGRTVGTGCSVRDPLSRYCQLQKGCKVETLDRLVRHKEEWVQIMVQDRRTPVPDQAAFRVDVPQWLARLACRTRKIARDLAMGNSATEVGRKHRISTARISQIRREMHESWNEFHGLDPVTSPATC